MIQITDTLPARAGIRDVTVEGQALKEAFVELGRSEAGVVFISSIGVREGDAVDNLMHKFEVLSQSIALNIADDLGPVRMRLRVEQLEELKKKLLGDAPEIPGLPDHIGNNN